MNGTKLVWTSKTFWVGILGVIVSVLAALAGDDWIAQYPQITAWVGSAFATLTIVLRILTETAVSFSTTAPRKQRPPG